MWGRVYLNHPWAALGQPEPSGLSTVQVCYISSPVTWNLWPSLLCHHFSSLLIPPLGTHKCPRVMGQVMWPGRWGGGEGSLWRTAREQTTFHMFSHRQGTWVFTVSFSWWPRNQCLKKIQNQKPSTEAILPQERMYIYGVEKQISKHGSFLVLKLVSI